MTGGPDGQGNPDAPQLPVRARALADGKLLYMAVPGLADQRPFILLDPARLDVAPRRAPPRSPARRTPGDGLALAEVQPVDLVVWGSVAVNREGPRVVRVVASRTWSSRCWSRLA